MLYTFWDVEKSTIEINVKVDYNTDEQTDNEIKGYNWHDKILVTLENLELNIKKENINSEIQICLYSICLYLQLVKNNYSKMKASNIVTNIVEKKIYHVKCIHSWAHDYVITCQIPYFC